MVRRACDAAGDIFIADTGNNRVREVVEATGKDHRRRRRDEGLRRRWWAGRAGLHFDRPSAVTLDSAGNLFIVDAGNGEVRGQIAATGRIVTVAGTPTIGLAGDGGAATSTVLDDPVSVLDASGDLFIAEEAGNRVRQVTKSWCASRSCPTPRRRPLSRRPGTRTTACR